MYTSNPYAQAGWSNPANKHSVNNVPSSSNTPQPSIYGALPFFKPQSPTTLLVFKFTSFDPNILNCIVMGPQDRPYFSVVNETPAPGCTSLQTSSGETVSVVEWHQQPVVEIKGAVSRQLVSQWITLSPDRSYRVMIHAGKSYSWVPRKDSICLYSSAMGTAQPELCAKVTRSSRSVTLEITTQTVQMGLLEVTLTAALLLQSGRSID